MFCKNCGKEIDANAAICVNCGFAKGTGEKFCANCGNEVPRCYSLSQLRSCY